MLIVTSEEMKTLEKQTMAQLGISSLMLMENAGSRIVHALQANYGPLQGKRIHILAGVGNNGGDGLVVARQLLELKARPKVYLIGNPRSATSEHRLNLEILEKLGTDLVQVNLDQLSKLKFSLSLADLVVDCLYGTGFKGSLTPEVEALIKIVNELDSPLVAVDVPSGVNATTGEVATIACQADLTINLGFLKTGCVLYPGRDFTGENIVVDLGVPLQETTRIKRHLLEQEILKQLPPRPAWGHKGTFGHCLVIGGSKVYSGAPALSGQAALRGGAGLVTVAVPEEIASRFVPNELILAPITSTDGHFTEQSIAELERALAEKNSLVIGPGLGDHPQVLSLVQTILTNWAKPVVIDADALKALTDEFVESISIEQRKQWILTPHPGEMASLVRLTPREVNADRLNIAAKLGKKWDVIVILKGAPTIITDGEKTYINSTGNHGLATGGTGDVLAGLIGSLLAQGSSPLTASKIAVYAHGAAGDLAEQQGSRGLIASDLLTTLPKILV